ncbi:MAG: response regulator transcription factor [Actinomycetota bacterium]|nr:response regulator transcription factor [Actinomycetota bacterium]
MSLLGDDDRIDVVGYAPNGAAAVELVKALQPGVVLMDVQMPGMDGIETTRRIKEFAPETAILILTASTSEEDVRRATAAGASGYLTKVAAASEVVSTVFELAAFAALPTSLAETGVVAPGR